MIFERTLTRSLHTSYSIYFRMVVNSAKPSLLKPSPLESPQVYAEIKLLGCDVVRGTDHRQAHRKTELERQRAKKRERERETESSGTNHRLNTLHRRVCILVLWLQSNQGNLSQKFQICYCYSVINFQKAHETWSLSPKS